ncbi:hypothetical protein COM18_09660 [Bacillus pseudomycoides]|nr:hypothetical protein COM18_09660 [Bacillus pseudomycoides]
MKYHCTVTFERRSQQEQLNFTVETDKSIDYLKEDITKYYTREMRYKIDGKLLGINIEAGSS